jgi:hypothetical protein
MAELIYTADTAEGKLLQLFEHILEDGDTVKVRGQDQTTSAFHYYLMRHLNEDIQLVSNVAMDDTTITVAAGHGIQVNDYIVIWENNVFEQARVTNVSGNVITIEIPVAAAYSANAKVIRGSINLNIDGSAGIDFEFKPFNLTTPIDIETVVITIQSGASVPDDGKFGGIAAITNGLFFRLVNSYRVNLGNYRTNKDFRDRGAEIEYTDKAPAGTNGTNIIFDIKETLGVVLRVGLTENERLFGRIRDNLSTLAGMTVSLLGQYTLGE